jgi:hypothetical protein
VLNVVTRCFQPSHQRQELIRHKAWVSLIARSEIGLDTQVNLTSIAEHKPNTSSNPKLHRLLDFNQT